jgi:hypothetical protein
LVCPVTKAGARQFIHGLERIQMQEVEQPRCTRCPIENISSNLVGHYSWQRSPIHFQAGSGDDVLKGGAGVDTWRRYGNVASRRVSGMDTLYGNNE